MRPITLVRVLFLGSFTFALFGACRETAPGSLVQQLQSFYAPATMEPNGLKVAKPGCTLVVQKDGLMANPISKVFGYYANTYQDGQVVTGKTGIKAFLPGRDKLQSSSARAIATGEKVYLLKVDIQDSGIVFSVQTCGRCEVEAADPAHKPYKASIDVKFQKGYLSVTDLKHIQETVAEILAFPEDNQNTQTDNSAAQQQQAPAQAAPPQQQYQQQQQQAPPPPPAQPASSFAPIAPPPPPPDEPAAKPVQIEKGQTIDQVTAALGQPSTILKGDGKQIYLFKDFKITFVNGKVSEIDIR